MSTPPAADSATYDSRSPADTEAFGRDLAERLRDGGLVFLIGPLGAGKTLLAKAVFGSLGVDPARVTSPTFQLVNRYRAPAADGGPPALYHIDLYRIEGQADLESLGLDEVFDSNAVILIEWAERLGGWPELEPIRVVIEVIDDDGHERRAITVAPAR